MPPPKVTKPLLLLILTKSLENQYTLSYADLIVILIEAKDMLEDVEGLINEVPVAASKIVVGVVRVSLNSRVRRQ